MHATEVGGLALGVEADLHKLEVCDLVIRPAGHNCRDA